MSKFAKIISLILIIILLLGILSTVVIPFVSAGTVSSVQSEINEIEKKKQQIEKQLASIENKEKSEYEKKILVEQKINETNKEIALINSTLSQTNEILSQKNQQLETANENYKEQYDKAKLRIRQTYEQGNISYWQIIIKSKSLFDFISRVEIVSELMEYDRKIVSDLKKTRNEIQEAKDTIQKTKDTQQYAKDQLVSKQNDLESEMSESNRLLNSYSNKIDSYQDQLEKARIEENKLQEEIRQLLINNKDDETEFVGGKWGWPISGHYSRSYITAYFNQSGSYWARKHTGIDISYSGIRGAAILASNSGTVLKAGWHNSYGNYVVISHGGGYTTLYAHADSLAVSAGQTVSRGQTIAYVGSTGNSSGPHVHFEISKDGTRLDPLNFFDI